MLPLGHYKGKAFRLQIRPDFKENPRRQTIEFTSLGLLNDGAAVPTLPASLTRVSDLVPASFQLAAF